MNRRGGEDSSTKMGGGAGHGYVYGPVPSRRLGLSLGLSIVPAKTCTLDCNYCQCGLTTNKTLRRESFYPVDDVVAQVQRAVRGRKVDFITFSGEGEPTLNSDIGRLIRRLKRTTRTPVAVITNATLLTDSRVRQDIYPADLVVPSLDAADQRTFCRVNRGHRDLAVTDIIEGLVTFRRHFRNRMWLEIMLARGVNDSVEHLVRLRQAVWRIKPDRVHLNTVVRPPAERTARPLAEEELDEILHLFGPGAEIASSPFHRVQRRFRGDAALAVLDFVRRRPATRQDLVNSLGIERARLDGVIRRLVHRRRLRRVDFWGKEFFETGPGASVG